MVSPRQPYYYGDPTPRGQNLMPGSAPSIRDQQTGVNMWTQFLTELPDQSLQAAVALGNLLERGLSRGKSNQIDQYIKGKQETDPTYTPSVLGSFFSDDLRETVTLREKERLANNASMNPFSARNESNPDVNWLDFLYSQKTAKFNPFSDKTIGEAMLDAALATGPIDAAFIGAAGSGRVARAIEPAYKSLRWKSAAAPLKGTLGATKLAFTPMTPSKNLANRLAAEAAVDLTARSAFEYDPLVGSAAILTPPGAYYAAKYGLNKTKKLIAKPDLLDYLNAQKNNPQGQIHIPQSTVENTIPILSGGSGRSTGTDPSWTWGDKTRSRGSNNASRPELRTGGENESIELDYALVDAEKLQVSHFEDGKINAAFNPDKQNRIERFQTKAEKEELRKVSSQLDPELVLLDTKTNKDGIPIVGDNLDASAKEVEMGNLRVQAIKKAKKDYPEMYQRYLDGFNREDGSRVKGLRETLEDVGIAPEELDKFDLTNQTPILVRNRSTQFSDEALLKSYIEDGNTPSGKALSETEKAYQYSSDWSDTMLSRLVAGNNIDQTLTAAGNRKIVNQFLEKNKLDVDYKNWVEENGNITKSGLKLLRQSLRVKVYGAENGAWLNNVTETTINPGPIRTILQALDSSLPDLATYVGSQKNYSKSEDYIISDEIIEAINHYISAKNIAEQNPNISPATAVSSYLSQKNMFEETSISEVARLLLTRFDFTVKLSQQNQLLSRKASAKSISTLIDEYHKQVEALVGRDPDFGTLPSKLEILQNAIKKTEDFTVIKERGADGKFRTVAEQKSFMDFQAEKPKEATSETLNLQIDRSNLPPPPTGLGMNIEELKRVGYKFPGYDVYDQAKVRRDAGLEWWDAFGFKNNEEYIKWVNSVDVNRLETERLEKFDSQQRMEYEEGLKFQQRVINNIKATLDGESTPLQDVIKITDSGWNPDKDSVPLNKKDEVRIEKEVRESMNIGKGEKTPAYGEKANETDISPDNSAVTKDNIEQAKVINKEDDFGEIPVSEEQAARDAEKKIVGGQKKPEVINKNIVDNNSKKQVVPTDQQNQQLNIDSADVGTSYKERTKANTRNFGQQVLNLSDDQLDEAGVMTINKVDELLKQHDKSMNVINGHSVVIPEREFARLSKVFKFKKITSAKDTESSGILDEYVKYEYGDKKNIEDTVQVMDKNIPDIDVTKADGTIVKERPTIQDIAARLPAFKPYLNSFQIKALNAIEEKLRPLADLYDEVLRNSDEGIGFREKVGIRGDIMEGGFYIPRGGAIEADGMLDMPIFDYSKRIFKHKALPGFRKPAEFESMAEGLAAGFQYDDLRSALSKYVRGIETESLFLFLETSMKNMESEAGGPLFKTLDDLLEEQDSGLIPQIKILKKEFNRLRNISNILENRAEDQIALMDPSKATYEEIQKIMSNTKIKAGPSKGYNQQQVNEQITIVNKKLKELQPGYDIAIARAKKGDEGYIEFISQGFRGLNGLYVDANVGKVINEYFEGLAPGAKRNLKEFLQGINKLNGFYTMMRSTFDDSGLGIQGIMSLYKNPKNWIPSAIANFKTLGKNDKNAYGDFVVMFDDEAVQGGRMTSDMWVSRGLSQQGTNTEFTMGSLKNEDTIFTGDPDAWLNKTGKGFRKVFIENRFNRAFSTFSDTLRLKEADALLQEELARNPGLTLDDLLKNGTVDEIAKTSNHLTGTTYISRTNSFRQDLGTLAFFAPRYYTTRIRNSIKAIKGATNPFTKDLEARIMRRAFTRMIIATTTITWAVNTAQGHTTDFNPLIRDKNNKIRVNGNFLRMRVGKRDYSLMGPAVNIPIHMVNIIFGLADGMRKTGKGDIDGAFTSVAGTALGTLRSVGSGSFKLGEQLFTNEEWDNSAIWDKNDPTWKKTTDIMLWLGDQLTPFSTTDLGGITQEAADEVKQGQIPIAPLFSLVAEPFGLTGSEMSYTDYIIQEALAEGLTYELLEPYQKREFKEKLGKTLDRRKQGIFRSLASVAGVDTSERESDYERLTNDRLAQEKQYYQWYKAGRKTTMDAGMVRYEAYTPDDFADDMQRLQTNINTRKAEQNEMQPGYGWEQSIDVDNVEALALDTWYGLGEEFDIEDPEQGTKYFDADGFYKAQDDFLAGREIKLPDGSEIMAQSNKQITYVERNTYDTYHEPEILAAMLRVGATGKNRLKYWYENRSRSEQARDEHKKDIKKQTAREKEKSFIIKKPSDAFPVGSIRYQPQIPSLPSFNFADYINQPPPVPATPTPVGAIDPAATPTPFIPPVAPGTIPFPEGSQYRRD